MVTGKFILSRPLWGACIWLIGVSVLWAAFNQWLDVFVRSQWRWIIHCFSRLLPKNVYTCIFFIVSRIFWIEHYHYGFFCAGVFIIDILKTNFYWLYEHNLLQLGLVSYNHPVNKSIRSRVGFGKKNQVAMVTIVKLLVRFNDVPESNLELLVRNRVWQYQYLLGGYTNKRSLLHIFI